MLKLEKMAKNKNMIVKIAMHLAQMIILTSLIIINNQLQFSRMRQLTTRTLKLIILKLISNIQPRNR
jgi:hypothetical protein